MLLSCNMLNVMLEFEIKPLKLFSSMIVLDVYTTDVNDIYD